MPHYHLHLQNAHVDASDDEGMDLADLATARARAIEGIRGFLGHEVAQGQMDLRGHIDIADDAGHILMTVRFDEAVRVIQSS